jgi:hypothetical protein
VKDIGQLAMLAGATRKGKAVADTAIVANGLLAIRGGRILYAGKALKAPKFKAHETGLRVERFTLTKSSRLAGRS